jgi:hypothetical protein
MKTTYGSRVVTKEPGMLRAFRITNLVRLDEETGDGRLLESAGAGTRELPRTVFGGFQEGDPHGPNMPIGRLDSVEFDPENNTATGWGWLLDDDNGRLAERYVAARAMRGNSIHMTEIDAELIWKSDDPNDPDFWDYTIVFHRWSVASTTMLGIPAFKDSQFELDEVTASLLASDAPLEIEGVFEVQFDVNVASMIQQRMEITASAGKKPPWEFFYRAEFEDPCPITIEDADENGYYAVYGNLARWNVCHEGIDARCVIAPYDPSDYAGFNCSHVLTDRGMVNTGPIFFLGGHPDKPIGNGDPWKAYGGIENAWGDVRVTHGQHGPWICGYVRPGVPENSIIEARASRISGHWGTDSTLKAIVSCNVPAYSVPASRVITDGDGNVLEMVASFMPDCSTPAKPETPSLGSASINITPFIDWSALNVGSIERGGTTVTFQLPSAIKDDEDAELARQRALAELELEDDPV